MKLNEILMCYVIVQLTHIQEAYPLQNVVNFINHLAVVEQQITTIKKMKISLNQALVDRQQSTYSEENIPENIFFWKQINSNQMFENNSLTQKRNSKLYYCYLLLWFTKILQLPFGVHILMLVHSVNNYKNNPDPPTTTMLMVSCKQSSSAAATLHVFFFLLAIVINLQRISHHYIACLIFGKNRGKNEVCRKRNLEAQ